jgi:hypothetical protein
MPLDGSVFASCRQSMVLLYCIAIVLFSGCSGPPRSALQAYTDAFATAQAGGIEIYEAMVPALQVAGTATPTAVDYPASLGAGRFDRTNCPESQMAYEGLLVRCAAFGVVRGFNEALLALNNAASVTTVQAHLDQAKDNMGVLNLLEPAVQLALPAAAAVLPQLEQAVVQMRSLRARAALRETLVGAAPLVEEVIKALGRDVSAIYDVQRAMYVRLLTDAESRIDASVGDAFALVAARDRPIDVVALALWRSNEERFEGLFASPEPSPGKKRLREVFTAGAPQFTSSDAIAVDRALDATERELSTFRQHVSDWQRFREALVAYDDLLSALEQAFTELVRASARPLAIRGDVAPSLEIIVDIREQVQEIRRLLDDRR